MLFFIVLFPFVFFSYSCIQAISFNMGLLAIQSYLFMSFTCDRTGDSLAGCHDAVSHGASSTEKKHRVHQGCRPRFFSSFVCFFQRLLKPMLTALAFASHLCWLFKQLACNPNEGVVLQVSTTDHFSVAQSSALFGQRKPRLEPCALHRQKQIHTESMWQTWGDSGEDVENVLLPATSSSMTSLIIDKQWFDVACLWSTTHSSMAWPQVASLPLGTEMRSSSAWWDHLLVQWVLGSSSCNTVLLCGWSESAVPEDKGIVAIDWDLNPTEHIRDNIYGH